LVGDSAVTTAVVIPAQVAGRAAMPGWAGVDGDNGVSNGSDAAAGGY
jgi:hypothetical protein